MDLRLSSAAFFLIAVALLGPISQVRADAVVIVGTFWRTNIQNSSATADKGIQIDSVCQAIQGAQALGHEVVLLTPNITCGGKVVKGRCAKGGECVPSEIQRELNALSAKIPKGSKQNLLIQTVGHGSPNMSPSWEEERGPWDNELGIGVGSLSAKELAGMINRSGLTTKAKQIRGLWTQCYSGGWNEMAGLLSPSGRFCSIAQSPHNETADVGIDEFENLGGPGFVKGFWDTQRATRGNASLHEATARAAHTQMSASNDRSRAYKWVSSSAYLADKATDTGEFYARTSSDDYAMHPPRAYFADGYDVERLSFYKAFSKATNGTAVEVQGIRERYKKHVSAVDDYNDEKWFFQDERKASGSFLYRAQTCQQNFSPSLGSANQDLIRSMAKIRAKMDSDEYAKIRTTLRNKLAEWEKDRVSTEILLKSEVKIYQQKNNILLEKSGRLMRQIELESADWETRKKLTAEYDALSKEFTELARLRAFPQIRKQLVVEKQVRQIESMMRLIDEKKIDAKTKDRILTTWECESTPVFSASKGAGS